jgi:hypothetical protein
MELIFLPISVLILVSLIFSGDVKDFFEPKSDDIDSDNIDQDSDSDIY